MNCATGAERLAAGADVVAMPLIPDEELAGSVSGVGGKPLRPQREAPLGPVDHGLDGSHLVIGSGRSCLDINDDRSCR